MSSKKELALALMEQLRHKGKDFVQNAWKWALEHPALAKYIIISGGFSVLMWFHSMRLRYVRNNTILELDLDGKEIVEDADPVAQMFNRNLVPLSVVLDSIYQAAKDRRVVGIVAKLGTTTATRTQWQEIRDAIKHFRATGKRAICFSEAFAEYGSGTALYWVATAFDQIYTSPFSTIHLIALRMDMMFLKGTLDKLDVEPHAVRRSEYKTALEQFTETKLTDPARANWGGVIDAISNQFAQDISEYLKKPAEEVKKLIAEGPYSAGLAKELGIITDTVYGQDFMTKIVPTVFRTSDIKNTRLLFFRNYFKNVGPRYSKGNVVALVHVSGNIMMGDEGSASHENFIQALRQVGDDPKAKAVIIRVDSPGGSALASDLMWKEIMRLKEEKQKKVIVSMGSMAASGGYYISCPADRILAMPLTITGSIGVFAGKMNTRGLWSKLGVTYDEISMGDNAGLFSSLEGFTPENRQRIEKFVEEIYSRFKDCVATGRNMTPEKAEEVAKGRVWMGEKAKEIGLVDQIGGFEASIEAARELLGLPQDAPIRLRRYPRDQPLLKTLLGSRNSQDQQSASIFSMPRWLAVLPLFGRSLATLYQAGMLLSRHFSTLSASPALGSFLNVVETGAKLSSEPALAYLEVPQ